MLPIFYENNVQVASTTSNVYTQTFASLTNGTSIKVRGYAASGCYGEETLRVYIFDNNQNWFRWTGQNYIK